MPGILCKAHDNPCINPLIAGNQAGESGSLRTASTAISSWALLSPTYFSEIRRNLDQEADFLQSLNPVENSKSVAASGSLSRFSW
ncbi:MAG: hypothetical protein JWQ42_5090 [Edaphobacter sp.]|nr:hypothetical protein [Edaphobacter sp.]